MSIEVVLKGRNHAYEAVGVFDGKGITVKKGSRISQDVSAKIQPIVIKLRKDKTIVDDNFILLQDVSFESASTAASFVSGTISNGLIRWRDKNGFTLRALQEKNYD